MRNAGPIIIVEDDEDDIEIVTDLLKDLAMLNEVIFFNKAADAFNFLKSSTKQPFIILCDINMPGINGFDLKRQIDKHPQLRQKSIPFIFFSTAATPAIVNAAYAEMTIQGFFQKSADLRILKQQLSAILEYWRLCKHPNTDVYGSYS